MATIPLKKELLKFRVDGLAFRVLGLGYRLLEVGFRVYTGLRVWAIRYTCGMVSV